MKVLLAVSCLLAVAYAQEEAIFEPGARRGTFLNLIQQQIIQLTLSVYPDGVNMDQTTRLAVMTARNDLCKINNPATQSQNSILLGKTCKKEFVKLYNEEPDQCGGMFCDVLTDIETKARDTMIALIEAEFDADFFDIIERDLINPAMEYSCRCSGKMMDAWMTCKKKIGDADIWYTLMNFGGFDTAADYLGGMDWKDFWVELVTNRVPWEDIELMLERTMFNLCQSNTDEKRADAKCYTYFYDAFNTLYQAYMKSTGLTPAVRRGGKGRSQTPEHCTTYDLSTFAEMSMENITFGDIKDAVVDKFCVEDCKDFYQEEFLGCCTASMVQDEELEDSVRNAAEKIVELYVEVFPEEEEAAESGIAEYVGYYEDAIEMMRNPNCEETDVSYDMTPCNGGDSVETEDPCAGLSGKKAKVCKKKQNKGGSGGDGGDAAEGCEGLSGKKLKICKKKAKKGGKGGKKGKGGRGGKGGKGGRKNREE